VVPLLDIHLSRGGALLGEFAGYCLTVDTSHELAVWLYGPPGGGKSTFIEGFKAMLGKYAGLLGLADIQRSRFALADLPGKTLVVAAEQPSDYISSSHILNAIISGEEILVERKFRDAFTVTPRAKIC
jgi:putative DNA primase/helicase